MEHDRKRLTNIHGIGILDADSLLIFVCPPFLIRGEGMQQGLKLSRPCFALHYVLESFLATFVVSRVF